MAQRRSEDFILRELQELSVLVATLASEVKHLAESTHTLSGVVQGERGLLTRVALLEQTAIRLEAKSAAIEEEQLKVLQSIDSTSKLSLWQTLKNNKQALIFGLLGLIGAVLGVLTGLGVIKF